MGTSLGVLLDEMSLDFISHDAEHVAAMNEAGALIEGAVTRCVKVRAKLPSQMEGEYDIVIFAVKQRETRAAASFVRPFLKEDGALVTVQNGLPEGELAKVFGKDRVYGCTLSWSAEKIAPGTVRVTSDTGFHLALGAYGKGEKLNDIAALLSHAGNLTVGNLSEIRFAKLTVNAGFSTLSALENTLAGRHCRLRSGWLASMLHTPSQRREEREAVRRCMQELEFVGLAEHAEEKAGSLSYGNQRLLEIARALASDPRLLILDEPAGGMNDQETVALVDTITAIRNRGITVLLIEHDMRLVMRICEKLVVLENGCLIAQGEPEAVRSHPAVIEAYLGAEDEAW